MREKWEPLFTNIELEQAFRAGESFAMSGGDKLESPDFDMWYIIAERSKFINDHYPLYTRNDLQKLISEKYKVSIGEADRWITDLTT